MNFLRPLEPNESLAQYYERVAIALSVPAALLVTILVITFNWQRNPVPMFEDWRGFGVLLLLAIAPLSLITGIIAFVMGRQAWNSRVPTGDSQAWVWAVLPITLAYTLLITALTIALLAVAEVGFRQLTLGRFQAAVVAGLLCGPLIHWMLRQIAEVTVDGLLRLTIIIMAGGIYIAAADVSDPFWWRVSFSYLGSIKSNAYYIFNSALIFAGIMFMVWLPYLTRDFKLLVAHQKMSERAARIFQIAILLLGIAIIFVGILRRGFTPAVSNLHDLAAYTMSAVLIFLMVGLWWLLPTLPIEIRVTSWLMVLGVIITVIAGAVGYFNTVGVELLSFILGMTWIQIFTHNVQLQARNVAPDAFPT